MIEDLSGKTPGRRFGRGWEKLDRPVEAVVNIVDPELIPQIGLSAKQLVNLDLKSATTVNAQELKLMVENNLENIPDKWRYPNVTLAFGDKKIEARVFNAFGTLSINKSDGIRVSRGVADALGISQGDTVEIL